MGNSTKYICINGWARNAPGDIVEAFEFGRYPPEIQAGFEVYKEPVQKQEPVKPAVATGPIKTVIPPKSVNIAGGES